MFFFLPIGNFGNTILIKRYIKNINTILIVIPFVCDQIVNLFKDLS